MRWIAVFCFLCFQFIPPVLAGEFYDGKRITLYVGYSAGGGYDRYTRVLARHIGRNIPGNPSTVVKNLPGAGGIRQVNAIYNTLPQDGTVIGIIGRGLVLEPINGNAKARFDPSRLQWIGSINQEYSTCVFWHTSGIATLQDVYDNPPVVGSTGPGSGSYMQTMMVNHVLGTKMRMVVGYPGGADINLAMEREEVQGRCSWAWSSIMGTGYAWHKAGKLKYVLQIGLRSNPVKDMQGIPLLLDLVKDDLDRRAIIMALTPFTMGRPFTVGPGVSADRVDILRKAFDATMRDPLFIADAKKGRLPLDPISGTEVQYLIGQMYAQPKIVARRMTKITALDNNFGITEAVIRVVTHVGWIKKVKRDGRRISWSGDGDNKGKLKVGKKTKIILGGNKASRKDLKTGLLCSFTVRGAQQALEINCT